MPSVSEVLGVLSKETASSEAEVMARAVEAGLRQLWRDRTLSLYLRGKIQREEAIDSVGLDFVELAERQRQAAEEDLDWALES